MRQGIYVNGKPVFSAEKFKTLQVCAGSGQSIIIGHGNVVSGNDYIITGNGNVVSMIGGRLLVDGQTIELGTPSVVHIEVFGNVEQLSSTSADVDITGNVAHVQTTSGDVTIQGKVEGDVRTVNGDVHCPSIGGDVETLNENIYR